MRNERGTALRTLTPVVLALLAIAAPIARAADPASGEPAASEARTWTSVSGAGLLATLERVADGKAYLRKTDGKLVAIPIDRLSAADRALAEGRAPAAESDRTAGADQDYVAQDARTNGFRGDGSCVYRDCAPVTHWSETSNIVRKTRLPWWGHGQGCMARGRIFLTCEPHEGVIGIQLLCIEALTGNTLWSRDVHMFDSFPPAEIADDRTAWLEDRAMESRLCDAARELAEMRPYLLGADNPTNAAAGYRKTANELRERGAGQEEILGAPRAGAWMYEALAAGYDATAATLQSETPRTTANRATAFEKWKRTADSLSIPYDFTAGETEGVIMDPSNPAAFELRVGYMNPGFQRTAAQKQFRARMSRDYGLYYNDWAQSGAFAGRTGFGSIGTAFPTPVTDGEFVYVRTGNNVVACYDSDGFCRWLRWFGPLPEKCGLSFLSSPILFEEKLILFDCSARSGAAMRALDKATGRTVWERDPVSRLVQADTTIGEHQGTPVITLLAGTPVIFAPDATVTRVSDGKFLGYIGGETGAWPGGWCSPTARTPPSADGTATVYFVNGSAGGTGAVPAGRPEAGSVLAVQLRLDDGMAVGKRLWVCRTDMVRGSQLVYNDGLLYADTQVIDPANGELLRKLPVWDYVRIMRDRVRRGYTHGSAHLLPIAGKYLYHLNSEGLCMVFETGRENAFVAVNSLGSPEHVFDDHGRPGHEFCYGASPWFSGNRIFIRSPFDLYCIGDPADPTRLSNGHGAPPGSTDAVSLQKGLETVSVHALAQLAATGRTGYVIAAAREIRRRLAGATDAQAVRSSLAPLVQSLVSALTINHMEQRHELTATLAMFGPDSEPAVPVLRDLLAGDEPMTRIQAMEAVSLLAPAAPEAALPLLMAGLADPTEQGDIRCAQPQAFRPPGVRDWAVIGLAAIGKQATNALPALLDLAGNLEDWEWNWDNGVGTRLYRRLVPAIAATGTSDELCDRLASDPSEREQAAIIMALGRVRPVSRRAVLAVLQARGRNIWKIRDRVIAAMGPGAAAGLVDALNEKTYGIPQAAEEHLVRLGAPAISELTLHAGDKAVAARIKSVSARIRAASGGVDRIPGLIEYLKDANPETRRWALVTIQGYGVKALPFLRPAVNDESTRSQAAEIIEHAADAGRLAMPGLLDLIRSANGPGRFGITDALTRKGEPMANLLKPHTREMIVGPVATEVVQRVNIANTAGAEAVPALIAYLSHPYADTQLWAATQLRLRGKASISELLKHKNDPKIGKLVTELIQSIDPTRK